MIWKKNLRGLFKVCDLCESYNEKERFICETKYSFCVICKWPIKKGHLIVMPKRCISQLENYKLTPDELYDYHCLIQTMEVVLNKLDSDIDVMTFKNSGKHTSQNHLHFHLIPSKSDLRSLFTKSEGTERRVLSTKESDTNIRDLICEKILN
jgi:diadenosine tetraphosphate (Ap4A) HIT family hydrolase